MWFFSIKFREIWTKILRTPRNLPPPTPIVVIQHHRILKNARVAVFLKVSIAQVCANAAGQSKVLAVYVTENLVGKYRRSGRNVTADKRFTSYSPVESLRENYGLTHVGSVRTNKREIPRVMIDNGHYSPGQSAFAFSKDVTLVTFASATSKANRKLVCLLTSMHDHPVICKNGKPQGLWDVGPGGTLFRGLTTKEGLKTEGTFKCLLLTNLE